MTTEYRSVEYRLHECLVQMQELLSILGFDQTLLDSIQDCKELIKNKQYQIAVMGEFKRGKSSLINALLGAKILPADATPTTATINRITYGTTPKAIITFRDGEKKEIPIGELANYVTKTTADGEARALRIKEATVYFPTMICQNHIDIIDTPGLNDEARMTQITIDTIANVDAVIVPIHARAPFSETEKNFVCQLIESDSISNLIFVVTFLDQLDEDDYEYEKFMAYIRRRIQSEVFSELEKRNSSEIIIRKAHRLLDRLQINGISSSQALESFISNNRELRKRSRFEPFYDALISIVTAKQLENAIKKSVETLHFVVSEFDGQNRKHTGLLENEFHKLESCKNCLNQYYTNSPKKLESILIRNSDMLQNMINAFNTNKNYIVNEFIRDLSQLRQNKHEVIRAALDKTSARVCDEIRKRCVILQSEMIHAFESILPPFSQQEREKLHFVSETLAASTLISFDDTAAAMMNFTQTIFGNAMFLWKASYGEIQDLTSCNVIEIIIQAADMSITNYIRELNQIVSIISKNWCNQFEMHLKALYSCVEEEITHRKEAQDMQYKAYLRNYQMFYQSAQEILQQSNSLWEEIQKED